MIELEFIKSVNSLASYPFGEKAWDIHFHWNPKGQYWNMQFEDLTPRIKIVCGQDLLNPWHYHLPLPTGSLFALDSKGKINTPNLMDLISGRVKLVYFEQDQT